MFSRLRNFYPNALYILIGINVVLFLLPLALSLVVQSNVNGSYGLFLYLLGGLRPDWVIADGEWWRVLNSTFLHADLWHLVANMFALLQIGSIVQSFYGRRWLWNFYILGGLGGSILSLIFLGNVATVGASGAVFGLIGVLMGGSLKRSKFGVELPFRFMDILPLALYAFVIGLIPGSAVNNWAHLGGLLVGLALGSVFPHQMTSGKKHNLVRDVAFWLCILVWVVCYIALAMSIYSKLFA